MAYFDDIIASENASSPEVDVRNKQLCKRIQEGDKEAKEELCRLNAGLVNMIVPYFYKKYSNRLGYDDLIQEGLLGLLKAAERMDYTRKTTFATYACFYITQAIRRAVQNDGYIVRLPVNVHTQIWKLIGIDTKFETLPLEERRVLEQKELGVSEEKLSELLTYIQVYLNIPSTDNIITESENLSFGGVVLVDKDTNPEKVNLRKCLREDLMYVMDMVGLTKKQKDIILYRKGFYTGEEMTLEEVGKIYNCTRERIRQIEAVAMRKFRDPAVKDKLRDYRFGDYLEDDNKKVIF